MLCSITLLAITFVLSSLPSRIQCLPSELEMKRQQGGAFQAVCRQIQSSVSSASVVSFPGSLLFAKDISHWASSSSNSGAACAVEPGSVDDVSTIIKILGSTRTPFAVKGGGHSTNPGFSSTNGVQIAMYRFSQVNYHQNDQTVDIGTGLIWDDVYRVLEPLGRTVVGGRVTGVGVAGFSLGGGYSWLSNQYGLTVDTIQAFELVLPNGTITTVTAAQDDLFFGLKGGFNNFGIVTKITLQTFPQGQVWGGLLTYTGDKIPAVTAATKKFCSQNQDQKASIITSYNTVIAVPGITQLLFYDGPTPPPGLFDDFLAIGSFTRDVKTRSYLNMVQTAPANLTTGTRGMFNTVSLLKFSPAVIDQIANQSFSWGLRASFLHSGLFVNYDVEPFLPSYVAKSQGGAYPRNPASPLVPLGIYWSWLLPSADSWVASSMKESADFILNAAIKDGQDIGGAKQVKYSNYAIAGTPVSEIYGPNVDRLRAIKQKYDPSNVMGLAGGFKL